MNNICETTILRRKFEVAHQLEKEKQLAVFDHERSELVVLNATAGAFWEQIDGEATLGEIATEMADSVQNAPPYADVLEHLVGLSRMLIKRGAVEEVMSE